MNSLVIVKTLSEQNNTWEVENVHANLVLDELAIEVLQ